MSLSRAATLILMLSGLSCIEADRSNTGLTTAKARESSWTEPDRSIEPDERLPTVRWEDAGDLVGQTAFVVGTIVRVGHTRRVHFLDFHPTRRDQFKAVIFTDDLRAFPGELESAYRQRIVRVRGTISRYAGRPPDCRTPSRANRGA